MEHLCVAGVPIFAGLDHSELAKIHKVLISRTYGKGEAVISPGDPGGNLYVVRHGRLKIARTSPQGKEQIVRFLEPGDFCGELSLFSMEPLPFTATCLEDTGICIIRKQDFDQILRENPGVALKILKVLGQRLSEAERLIEDLTLRNSQERVISLLVQLAEKSGQKQPDGTIVVNLSVSREELAHLIGTTQETLSRRLSALQEQGLIKVVGQKGIVLLNPQGLGISPGG